MFIKYSGEVNIGDLINIEFSHHFIVARLKRGDFIHIKTANFCRFKGFIEKISKYNYMVRIIEQEDIKQDIFHIDLFTAIPKKKLFENLIYNVASIGVTQIYPLIFERSIKMPDFEKYSSRWQKIMAEAEKQSGCNIPIIYRPKKIDIISSYKYPILLCSPYTKNLLSVALKKVIKKRPARIGVIIGPEGGLSEKENFFLTQNKAIAVLINKNILRIEIAACTAISIINTLQMEVIDE